MTEDEMPLSDQVKALRSALASAIADASADMGEGAAESGGWVEITRTVVMSAGPEIGDEARREVLRMAGLEPELRWPR